MPDVTAIPALSDNYIWAIAPLAASAQTRVAIVDPGEAAPVQAWLARNGCRIGAIIITHHHADHTAGMDELIAAEQAAGTTHVPVYGPAAERDRIPQITQPLTDGDNFTLDWLDLTLAVIAVPGHTLGHIALHGDGLLLAGDTLFRGGCGRVFEGTAEQMQTSLARLRALDPATRVYAGHEYTQKNLAFAHRVEPDNADITRVADMVDALRADGHPSLPATLGEECRINPFLRWDQPAVIQAASQRAGRALAEPAAIFAQIRAWKDAA